MPDVAHFLGVDKPALHLLMPFASPPLDDGRRQHIINLLGVSATRPLAGATLIDLRPSRRHDRPGLGVVATIRARGSHETGPAAVWNGGAPAGASTSGAPNEVRRVSPLGRGAFSCPAVHAACVSTRLCFLSSQTRGGVCAYYYCALERMSPPTTCSAALHRLHRPSPAGRHRLRRPQPPRRSAYHAPGRTSSATTQRHRACNPARPPDASRRPPGRCPAAGSRSAHGRRSGAGGSRF